MCRYMPVYIHMHAVVHIHISVPKHVHEHVHEHTAPRNFHVAHLAYENLRQDNKVPFLSSPVLSIVLVCLHS